MKTIILVWHTNFINLTTDSTNNFFGLGDVLRGTISMFQLSKKYNFRLIVDIQLHPVSKFLKYKKHEYSNLIKDNENNISFIYPEHIVNYIENNNEDVSFIFTNSHIMETINDECKYFIKNILIPTDEFAKYIYDILKSKNIPLNYNIFHFRLGDSMLVRNNNDMNFQFNLDLFNKYKENNDILMSDNVRFKENVMNIDKSIYLFHINIAHLGYEQHKDNIKDTLLEFFITTKAQKIKTYTIYGHRSGFVNIANIIYNVPLHEIKY
jgi:hypothetical protein